MSKILVFDNYDSFTYNLVHLVEKITCQKVDIFRNDAIDINAIDKYDKIILSPGPGLPAEAGILLSVIKKYAPQKSLLGVCLGHQAIAQAFGASLINLNTVYHGMATTIKPVVKNARLLKGLGTDIEVGRYHSWVVSQDNFTQDLQVTAVDDNNYIMALQHKIYDVQGVQFHPESVLSPKGEQVLKNWLDV